jgi:hypothetical protein
MFTTIHFKTVTVFFCFNHKTLHAFLISPLHIMLEEMIHTKLLVRISRGNDIERILKKEGMRVCTGFTFLRAGFNGTIFVFHKSGEFLQFQRVLTMVYYIWNY